MLIAPVMPSIHLILWHPFLLLPFIFPSIRDFSSESSVLIRQPKYWNFSFSPSSWSPLRLTGLIYLLSKRFSGVFSSTTVQRHQFFSILFLFGPALTTICDHWEDHNLDCTDLCQQTHVSAFQFLNFANVYCIHLFFLIVNTSVPWLRNLCLYQVTKMFCLFPE